MIDKIKKFATEFISDVIDKRLYYRAENVYPCSFKARDIYIDFSYDPNFSSFIKLRIFESDRLSNLLCFWVNADFIESNCSIEDGRKICESYKDYFYNRKNDDEKAIIDSHIQELLNHDNQKEYIREQVQIYFSEAEGSVAQRKDE